MKLEKIKLRDIVDEQMSNDELKLLKGGEYANGCPSHVCNKSSSNTDNCTHGDAICHSRLKI